MGGGMPSVTTSRWAQGGRRGERYSQGGRKFAGLVTLFCICCQSELPKGPGWRSSLKDSLCQRWGCHGDWMEALGVNTSLASCFGHWCVTRRALLKSTLWRLRFQTSKLLQFEQKNWSVKSPCLEWTKLIILATHKPLLTFITWYDAKQSASGKPPNFPGIWQNSTKLNAVPGISWMTANLQILMKVCFEKKELLWL